MALELGGQVDVAQVGVAVEADAEHLVGLALVPGGPGVGADPRADAQVVVGHVGLQEHPQVGAGLGHRGEDLDAGVATGVAGHGGRALGHGRREGHVDGRILVAAVGRGQPVDGGQEVEALEAGGVTRHLGRLRPGGGGDADPEPLAGLEVRLDDRVAQVLREHREEGFATVVRGHFGRVVGGGGGVVSQRRSAPAVLVAAPALGHVLVLDALLQQHDALEQGLGPGRAAGDVDVDGDDLVDALGDRVAVPVRPAAVGAAAHRDDVLGVGHLLVEALDGRHDLVGDGAGDDHEVGLAGAGRERDHAEAHHVVAGASRRRRPSRWRSRPGPTGRPRGSTCG